MKSFIRVSNSNISSYLNSEESLYLWKDEDGMEVDLNFLFLMDGEEEILEVYSLSSSGKKEFIKGFKDFAPKDYDEMVMRPWDFSDDNSWFDSTLDPYTMGKVRALNYQKSF